jgi:precorrin-8X/cobalt-precorrin-8 methylmutase
MGTRAEPLRPGRGGLTDPTDAEHPLVRESFRLIDAEIGAHGFSADEYPLVRRVIHATADFEFKSLLRFSTGAVAAGVAALRAGRPIVADVRMVQAGISRALSGRAGVAVHCRIDDEAIAAAAAAAGQTRAETALESLARGFPQAVFAIGNAPTALLRLVRLIEAGVVRPALVVGVPVGFVGVQSAKAALTTTSAPYIVSAGRKGGSPVAAALVNGLLAAV